MIKFRWKPDDDTAQQIALIQYNILKLEEKIMTLTEAIAGLSAKVSEQGTVIESAITLLSGLSAQLTAAKVDPAVVTAITDQISLQNAALAGAVTTNTPAP